MFIVKVLIDYNDKQGEKYKMSCTFRDEKIIKLIVTDKAGLLKGKLTL